MKFGNGDGENKGSEVFTIFKRERLGTGITVYFPDASNVI
jgi:hypothetical protein